jgi:hypothetical protein
VELIEAVYEGGEVLDLALEAQRGLLESELRARFTSVDLRGLSERERITTLRNLVKTHPVVKNILVRGLSGVCEASQFFLRSSIFMDALGRSETPTRSELSQFAFRTKRVFVYSFDMDQEIRGAGIGLVSRHSGPFFPRVEFTRDPVPEPRFVVGVLAGAGGALEVLGKLKQLQKKGECASFDIVTTEKISGVSTVRCAMDVAEQSDLLLSPSIGADRLGPDEGAILALCTSRALCTATSAGFRNLPYSTGRYIAAEKYAPGSYANAALLYPQQRKVLDGWSRDLSLDWDAVPREILRRL